MSESERVQRWRQRMREAGKEPLTIWLTTAEKLRLEDMALRQRCSPSELASRMLAQWHGEPPSVSGTVTDTEQLRAIVQHEPPLAQTVTDMVTATLQQTLPGLVRALIEARQAGNVTATVTDTSTATKDDPGPEAAPERGADNVADTVTDTVVLPMTYPVKVATTDTVVVPMTAPVTDTVTDTVTAATAKRKAPPRQRVVTDNVSDTVTVTDHALEPFDTTRYVLGKLCPRHHDYHDTGQSLLRRTNRHCCACDREKFHERKQAKRQEVPA